MVVGVLGVHGYHVVPMGRLQEEENAIIPYLRCHFHQHFMWAFFVQNLWRQNFKTQKPAS